MRGWLPISLVVLAACGGNVILDGGAGSTSGATAGSTSGGGLGGATGSSASMGASSTGGASSTSAFMVDSGPPPCNVCAAIFGGADPTSVCPGMETLLLKTMETCVCQSDCQMACADLCTNNGPVSQGCKECTLNSAGGGCFQQVQACFHEM